MYCERCDRGLPPTMFRKTYVHKRHYKCIDCEKYFRSALYQRDMTVKQFANRSCQCGSTEDLRYRLGEFFCAECKSENTYRVKIRKHKKQYEKKFFAKYGIMPKELKKLRKKCDICGDDHLLGVDHCHDKVAVRGILCRRCNSGLGFFRDNADLLLKAVRYLKADNLLAGKLPKLLTKSIANK